MRVIGVFLVVCIMVLGLASCDSLNRLRYPCQEFSNWAKPECNPPECKAEGLCTEDLFPPEFWDQLKVSPMPTTEVQEEVIGWINRGGLAGTVNIDGYIARQTKRYADALYTQNRELASRILADANKVGFVIVPALAN